MFVINRNDDGEQPRECRREDEVQRERKQDEFYIAERRSDRARRKRQPHRQHAADEKRQDRQLLDLLQPSKMRVFGAAGVTEDVKLLQLPRLSLGLSKMEKINAAVLDLEPVNETAGFQQAGILGGNFLRHFRIYFDFARGAMRLEPLNQKPKSVENVNPEAVVTP